MNGGGDNLESLKKSSIWKLKHEGNCKDRT